MTDTPKTTVRPLAPSDREVWGELWHAYLDFYETTLPDAVYDSTFARLMGSDPYDPIGLIAEVEGRPVGLVHYLFHRHCWKIENPCYLQDLYVRADTRGTGAGRALIQAVYAAADAEGVPSVYWTTQHFNETARKLYDRIGTLTPFIKYQRP